MELLKQGTAKDGLRAYRFAKRKLGTHSRANRKKAELEDLLRAEKQATLKRQA